MRRDISAKFCRLAVLIPLLLFIIAFDLPCAQAASNSTVLITQSVDESKLITLFGNTRPEATAKNDRGRVADSHSLEHMMLQLKRSPEQEHELQQAIDEMQDKSSPNFHHWLTAKEVGERFGLAQQDLDTIQRWLQSHGFKVNVVYENGLLIDFSGTAGQVREAFHTEIHHLNVNGAKHIANMSDPKIPAALAQAVTGVVSLHNFMPQANYRLRPDYTIPYGNSAYLYAVTPPDLATIYNFNPLFAKGITGLGQTIAVIEDSDVYTMADWASFRSTFGLSSYTAGTFTEINPSTQTNPPNCDDPGVNVNYDWEEAILDAEYASASAPSAAIVLASCQSSETTFGGLIALQNLLNGSSAPPPVISMSYGECEAYLGAAGNAAYYGAYQQAAAEGVSMFVSSGDDGATGGCGEGIGASGLASTPYNVAVGGTDFSDTYANTNSTYWSATNSPTYESALSYIPEIPWNASCASQLIADYYGNGIPTYGKNGFCNVNHAFVNQGAGSGGPSGCATGSPSVFGVVGGTCAGWPKPSWQSLVGNPSDGVRDIPDVSLFASNAVWGHYYPVCISVFVPCSSYPPSDWPGAGGTSFASPIMAGIQALVNQKTGERQGNPNPVYYSLAASEYGASGDSSCNSTLGNTVGSSCTFYDVTQGDNDVPCVGHDDCYGFVNEKLYGVLSTSKSSYEPAYRTTTGWDFATGIGSVNATNLVNNWPKSTTPTFTFSAWPYNIAIAQGSSGQTTITLNALNGFKGNVTLSVAGLPSGVTATFGTNPLTSTSTLTLTASATATLGTSTVTITGTSGTLTKSTTMGITVNAPPPPSFSLTAAPNTVSISQGGTGSATITVVPTDGFSGHVGFIVSGLPNGVTASFSPKQPTSTSVLTLKASSTAATGTVTLTIGGSSGRLSAATTITLTVNPSGDFSLTASPETLAVAQGSSGTSAITINPTNAFDKNVALKASGLPAGVTASISPNPATSSSTLALRVRKTASIGTSTITITGKSGSLSHTTTINLTVTE